MSEELLPDSRLKEGTKGSKVMPFGRVNRLNWAPIFCANCGKPGGFVPEENMTFAFYLCDPCGEKWAPLVGTMAVPDEVFWQKVKGAQIEKYGRLLTAVEIAEALKDENHILTKLGKERRSGS